MLLLVAGHETTMNLIGNGLLALLRHPDQLELLRTHPELMPAAVEELLRYDTPVRRVPRIARCDTLLDGQRVAAGEQVVAMLHDANHDPAVFPSPDALDITRDARRHVAFGAGAHYCLGAPLARAEAQVALAALIDLPDLQLETDEPQWRPVETLHALEALPVRFAPAHVRTPATPSSSEGARAQPGPTAVGSSAKAGLPTRVHDDDGAARPAGREVEAPS
jgi:cytochrome P450